MLPVGKRAAIQIDGVLAGTPEDLRPFVRLWAAVLGQVVRDIRRGPADATRAAVTYATRDDRDGPGSFPWVCEVVGIAPDRARSALFPRLGA